jgi:porin
MSARAPRKPRRKRYEMWTSLCVAIASSSPCAAASPLGLFGDWGGLLPYLLDRGVDVQAAYVSEAAWNPSGGKQQAARYADQLGLSADFDLKKIFGLDGAKLRIALTNRDGRNLTQDAVGNEVLVQEIYGDGQNLRLSDFSYEQALGQRVEVRLGRIHESDDFAHFSCEFQNLSFCSAPFAILADSGWNNPPLAVWGGTIKLNWNGWYAETGAYQVNPTYALSGNGFKLSTSGDTGTVYPVEAGWVGKLGSQGLASSYKAGAYYDSSNAPDVYEDENGNPLALTDLPPRQRDGRSGEYLMILQQVTQGPSSTDSGISVFAHLTQADRNTALLTKSYTVGAIWKAPVMARPDDTLEIAAARFNFNPRLRAEEGLYDTVHDASVAVQNAETDLTLQYNAKLTPFLSLGPNLQYIVRPNGSAVIANAFVVGLQLKVTL